MLRAGGVEFALLGVGIVVIEVTFFLSGLPWASAAARASCRARRISLLGWIRSVVAVLSSGVFIAGV